MSPLFSIVAFLFFLGWAFYRLVIKKDLKNHLDTLYPGLFFLSVWLVIYWLLLR
jgi:tellurite resistance protein TehA-like permease